jgi:hypothetical protein
MRQMVKLHKAMMRLSLEPLWSAMLQMVNLPQVASALCPSMVLQTMEQSQILRTTS